jgi:Tol biopolymer transport system component
MDVTWSPDGSSLAFGTLGIPNAPVAVIDLRSRRVSTLPGSMGLFSPRWSPDGKFIVALRSDPPSKLMLFDTASQAWTQLYPFDTGYQWWSHDGKYIYFQSWKNPPQSGEETIYRLQLSDRKVERIIEVEKVGRLTTGTITDWFGLAPDDSPLFARDIGATELYALDVQWP